MASEELEDRDREIERLQAELREARENLSDEKQHSDFMENLVAARHGAGWEQLTIDAANNVRESAERLLQEREMQVAGLVGILNQIKERIIHNCEATGDLGYHKRDTLYILCDKALTNLPDVSKYRRLMEAVSLLCDDACGINLGAKLDMVREAFRAIKART